MGPLPFPVATMPSCTCSRSTLAPRPIGKLESVNVNAQDIGEEFVDVQARMDNVAMSRAPHLDSDTTGAGRQTAGSVSGR